MKGTQDWGVVGDVRESAPQRGRTGVSREGRKVTDSASEEQSSVVGRAEAGGDWRLNRGPLHHVSMS